VPCYKEFVPKAGCDLDDIACQCEPEFLSELQPKIAPCLVKACEADDLEKAAQAAEDICADYEAGTLPRSASSASAPAPPVAVAASTSSAAPSAKHHPKPTPAPSHVVNSGNGTVTMTKSKTGSSSKPTDSSSSPSGAPDSEGRAAAYGPAAGIFGAAVAAVGFALL
jgi:hypothetical protein